MKRAGDHVQLKLSRRDLIDARYALEAILVGHIKSRRNRERKKKQRCCMDFWFVKCSEMEIMIIGIQELLLKMCVTHLGIEVK
jgi:hypothetical protein